MPQLNFTIPDALLAKVDAAKPDYLDRKGFLCLLLDQALDTGTRVPAYCVGAEPPLGNLRPHTGATLPPQQLASEASSEAPLQTVAAPSAQPDLPLEPKKKNKAQKYVFSVPSELEEVKADLLEFWTEYKDGKKTRASGALLVSGCKAILEKYGVTALREQIQLACANNWQSITLKNYEQFGLSPKRGSTLNESPGSHPASRVYTAKDFELPDPSNPIANLF
jgi:hypothetical protein